MWITLFHLWYTSDPWSQKIGNQASGGRFWNVASDVWFWNIVPDVWFQNIAPDASQTPARHPPDACQMPARRNLLKSGVRRPPDASQTQCFEILHLMPDFETLRVTPARRQPDELFRNQASDARFQNYASDAIFCEHASDVQFKSSYVGEYLKPLPVINHFSKQGE